MQVSFSSISLQSINFFSPFAILSNYLYSISPDQNQPFDIIFSHDEKTKKNPKILHSFPLTKTAQAFSLNPEPLCIFPSIFSRKE